MPFVIGESRDLLVVAQRSVGFEVLWLWGLLKGDQREMFI